MVQASPELIMLSRQAGTATRTGLQSPEWNTDPRCMLLHAHHCFHSQWKRRGVRAGAAARSSGLCPRTQAQLPRSHRVHSCTMRMTLLCSTRSYCDSCMCMGPLLLDRVWFAPAKQVG